MFCLRKKFLPNNQKEITTNIHKGYLKKLIIKYLEIKMNLLNKSLKFKISYILSCIIAVLKLMPPKIFNFIK
jgi:hypothetical protein